MKDLNWAVLGVGVIAKTLYAVANRTHDKAVAFAEKYNVAKVYDAIDEIFTDKAVDVIYLTTPHNTHYQFMKRALENGKHLLVEKSITLNSRELDETIALAAQNNLILAEAMTIWHMPLYKNILERISRGDFGKVQILFQPQLGGRRAPRYWRLRAVDCAFIYGGDADRNFKSMATFADRLRRIFYNPFKKSARANGNRRAEYALQAT